MKVNFDVKEMVAVKDITIHKKNLEKFPLDVNQIDSVKKLIEISGLDNPIVITSENQLVDGKHRLHAVMKMNEEFIPVIRRDFNTEQDLYLFLINSEYSQKDKTKTMRACEAVLLRENSNFTMLDLVKMFNVAEVGIGKASKVKQLDENIFNRLLKGDKIKLDNGYSDSVYSIVKYLDKKENPKDYIKNSPDFRPELDESRPLEYYQGLTTEKIKNKIMIESEAEMSQHKDEYLVGDSNYYISEAFSESLKNLSEAEVVICLNNILKILPKKVIGMLKLN